ncbi:hypothetical protein ACFQMJ_21695 [Cohnella cellulosilytica]|uniref:Uncharacterized protein n=1 Tax=Cohnella cellulosilytica TaxID=986710 RepID=A0ABW2FD20_9BACL
MRTKPGTWVPGLCYAHVFLAIQLDRYPIVTVKKTAIIKINPSIPTNSAIIQHQAVPDNFTESADDRNKFAISACYDSGNGILQRSPGKNEYTAEGSRGNGRSEKA